VPKLAELLEFALPIDGIFVSEMRLLPGFWIFCMTCFFEKLAVFIVTEQCLVAVSEREAESLLRAFARSLPPDPDHAMGSPLSPSSGDHIIEDAAEGLLESDAGAVFSPAARYFSSYFPHYIYAGLPRWFWGGPMVRLGLLAEARLVERHRRLGVWDDAAAEALELQQQQYSQRRGTGGTGISQPLLLDEEQEDEELHHEMEGGGRGGGHGLGERWQVPPYKSSALPLGADAAAAARFDAREAGWEDGDRPPSF
jgi:hypothetical protein